jgi:hypothetical protein
MKAAHMGMGVGGSDFDALVQDLVGALAGVIWTIQRLL